MLLIGIINISSIAPAVTSLQIYNELEALVSQAGIDLSVNVSILV